MDVNTAIMEGLKDYYSKYADTRYHLGWKLYKSYVTKTIMLWKDYSIVSIKQLPFSTTT